MYSCTVMYICAERCETACAVGGLDGRLKGRGWGEEEENLRKGTSFFPLPHQFVFLPNSLSSPPPPPVYTPATQAMVYTDKARKCF